MNICQEKCVIILLKKVKMALAFLLFFITLFLILYKPKYMGYSAVFMAIVAVVLKTVSLRDVIEVIDIVWDATLTFIGIIIFSLILDEIGFFNWAAIKIAKFSRGNGYWMFINSMLLGSVISAFFANDTAALILTPILLSKMKMLKLNTKTLLAFMFAGGFIADSASLPFVFSNLTNIITADYFHLGFIEYFQKMILPFIISVIVSTMVLFLFFKKEIPQKIDINLLPEAKSVIKNKKLFIFSWYFLTFLFLGYIIGDLYHIPVCFFALGGAMVFLLISCLSKTVSFTKVLKNAPWQILWFSIGLYIVVFSLKNAGLTDFLHMLIKNSNILQVGFLSGILSAFLNNLPSVMLMDIALKGQHHLLVYANVIGANIGPKLTPFGSLSTLLWLDILRKKGIKITFWQYIKFGMIITPIVLFFTLLILEIK